MRLFPLSSSSDLAFYDPRLVFSQPFSIQWNLDLDWYEVSDVVRWDPVDQCCYWLIVFCSSSTGLVSFSPLISTKGRIDSNSGLHSLCSIDDKDNLHI